MTNSVNDRNDLSGRPRTKLSAVVITKNEEDIIRRCLDSLKGWVDEVVIVDDVSVDRTVAIAREEYGAKIVFSPLNGDFAGQRNKGLAAASGEWILQMDADEVVPPESARKISEAVDLYPDCDGFEILRRDCVFDVPLTYRGSCAQLRLVKKGRGVNRGDVHEELRVEGPVRRLDASVLHYNLSSVSQAVAKNNFYTDLEVALYLEKNPEVDWRTIRYRILFKTVPLFYKHYVRNKAYKDGAYGLVRAALNTFHPFLFWLKVLERALKEKRLKF